MKFRPDSNGYKVRGFILSFGALLAIALASTQEAKADFVGIYALGNFTLTNTDNGGFPSGTNGTAVTTDDGLTVVITGGNSGSGLPGETDLFIDAAAAGTVQFNWSYTTQDIPGFDSGGYLLNNTFTQLSDGTGLSDTVTAITGTETFNVTEGEQFGFAVQTVDNQGYPGLLTISDFSAPVATTDAAPEPRMTLMVLVLAAATVLVKRSVNRASQGSKSENVPLLNLENGPSA